MTLADILRERLASQTKRQPTIGAATQPPYFGSVDPLTEYGGAVEESYNPLEDLAPVGGVRRLLGAGGSALGLGSILLKNPYEKAGVPLAPLEAINRGVRSLGREAMEFLRAKGRDFTLRFDPKQAGTIKYPRDIYINPEFGSHSGFNPRTTIEHEFSHGLYRELPSNIKKFARSEVENLRESSSFTPVDPAVPSSYKSLYPATRLEQMRSYDPSWPEQTRATELFAIGSESPTSLAGQMLEPEAKAKFDRIRRTVRGMLRSHERQKKEIISSLPELPELGAGAVNEPKLKLADTAPGWFKRVWNEGRGEIPTSLTPRRLPVRETPSLVKNPVTYELPEAADELAPLLEQLGGSYGPRKLPPVSGGAPSMFEKFKNVPAKDIKIKFLEHARNLGYNKKVIGDDAYTNRAGKTIRLKSGKGGRVTVWEEGKGIYELD